MLEAMAHGTPVVTSAGTASAEVAGDAALLVDPKDPAALQTALSRLLEDSELADRLRHDGRLRASHYTWERTAELTVGAVPRAVSPVPDEGRCQPALARARPGRWDRGVPGRGLLGHRRRHPPDVEVTVFAGRAALEAHPDLRAGFDVVEAPTGGRPPRPGAGRGDLARRAEPATRASTCSTTSAARCPSSGRCRRS